MAVAVDQWFRFDNSFVRDLSGLFEPWQPAPVPAPRLLALNLDLVAELGIDPDRLRSDEGVAILAGNSVPGGAASVAQAYAGHQFGGYSPRLGDGRALLLGEVIDARGRRRDLHLKGSGRTPFARGGDGKAAVGPMLREYVVGEAMHALGIPTTRALAVVATGEQVARETWLPGAVLTRVAASHLRVGSFQYAAAHPDTTLLRRLADHAIDRHHPSARDTADPYLALFDAVVATQAALVARWMLVGFIHGVMNTDNMTISGETIDYGPCAFMDAYDPTTVFSSIDHSGRYAYGNQPLVAQWNLARLAETLLPLVDTGAIADGEEAAARHTRRAVELVTEVLQSFEPRFQQHWDDGIIAKLGVAREHLAGTDLVGTWFELLQTSHADMTASFRALAAVLRGDRGALRDRMLDIVAFDAWIERWLAAVDASGRDRNAVADDLDRHNPVYVPRNHLVEEALAAATDGDLAPFHALLDVVTDPFAARPGLERYAEPAPPEFGRYRTFCGT